METSHIRCISVLDACSLFSYSAASGARTWPGIRSTTLRPHGATWSLFSSVANMQINYIFFFKAHHFEAAKSCVSAIYIKLAHMFCVYAKTMIRVSSQTIIYSCSLLPLKFSRVVLLDSGWRKHFSLFKKGLLDFLCSAFGVIVILENPVQPSRSVSETPVSLCQVRPTYPSVLHCKVV